RGKPPPAGLVELRRRKRRDLRSAVVAIEHDGVEGRPRTRDPLGAVPDPHGEARIVLRDLEGAPRDGEHAGIYLDHLEPRLRYAVIDELGERPPAEPYHQDAPGVLVEEQERHHAARLRELEIDGAGEPHRALYRVAADVERAHAEALGNVHLVLAARRPAPQPLRETHRR